MNFTILQLLLFPIDFLFLSLLWKIPRRSFRTNACLFTNTRGLLLSFSSSSPRFPLPFAFPLICPPVPLPTSLRCFFPLRSLALPLSLCPSLTHSFSFSLCVSRFSPHALASPPSEKEAASLTMSFLPTIAHYRRDRWDLNPPLVVVERGRELYMAWERERDDTQPRNGKKVRYRRGLFESLSKVPRGSEERLDLNLPFILFIRLISRISDFYVISINVRLILSIVIHHLLRINVELIKKKL